MLCTHWHRDLIRRYLLHSFRSCEVLLVLSCLGQAADVLASTTRSSATGRTLKAPLKLEQVNRSGEVPDRSARCLKKGGSPAMFHRPALLRSTCTKRVEVSQTPTLILERRKG